MQHDDDDSAQAEEPLRTLPACSLFLADLHTTQQGNTSDRLQIVAPRARCSLDQLPRSRLLSVDQQSPSLIQA